MDTLFEAVNIAGVNTNVSTLLVSFIGINLLFLGYGFIKKTFHRA